MYDPTVDSPWRGRMRMAYETMRAVLAEREREIIDSQSACTVHSLARRRIHMAININTATTITDEEVAGIFDYQPWDQPKIDAGKIVRGALGVAFKAVIEHVPPCPDRTVALRKIREARMDANSAITHGGKY